MLTRQMRDENQTVLTGNPNLSTIKPPRVGPTKEPQKNDVDHIPRKQFSIINEILHSDQLATPHEIWHLNIWQPPAHSFLSTGFYKPFLHIIILIYGPI